MRAGLEVVVFERAGIAQQLLVGLAIIEGRLAELADPACVKRFLHLGIGAESVDPIAQHQVELHVGSRRFPDTVHVLGTQRQHITKLIDVEAVSLEMASSEASSGMRLVAAWTRPRR